MTIGLYIYTDDNSPEKAWLKDNPMIKHPQSRRERLLINEKKKKQRKDKKVVENENNQDDDQS